MSNLNFFDHIYILYIFFESLTYVCIDAIYQITYQSPMPPPINCTEIPRFLAQYEEQIKPDCKLVEYVFELFKCKQHAYFVNQTDLARLIVFIKWCNSSMLLEYLDTITVRNLLANGVTHLLNHEPVFQDRLKFFTDKGVNLKKFRKCAIKIYKFRLEVYMSVFSDILEFEYNERIRHKKELFDAAQRGDSSTVHLIMNSKHASINKYDIIKALHVSIWNEYNDVAQILIHYLQNLRLPFEGIKSSFNVAVSHSNIECVRMFLDIGIDINLTMPEGNYMYGK